MKRALRSFVMAALCIALMTTVFMAVSKEAKAAGNIIATVDGTVASGTSSDILQLNVSGQIYKIKLDSKTETTNCKILLPGNKVTVELCNGNDGYLHAAKITTTSTVTKADSALAKSSVTGKVLDGTTADVMKLETIFGTSNIKMDSATDFSNCNFFTIGSTVEVVVYKAKDGNLYAESVKNTAASYTNATVTNTSGTTYDATGTVAKGSNANLILLDTEGGQMQIKIDANTNASAGRVLVPGLKITVSYYRGSDAYLHASAIKGNKSSSTATVDTLNKYSVGGSIGDKSTEDVIVLCTSSGDMKIKLDSSTTFSNNSVVLTAGTKVSVTCARGSDAYLHATSITFAN